MSLFIRTTLAAALGAASLPAAIVAQQTPPASAESRIARIDSIFSFATSSTPGCAVGASQNGTVIANRAYGLANVERNTPLGAGSMFDIGSTQKQFVAAAVLLLVEDRRLSLTDDIRKYVPELHDYGHRITLDHLLTHTSGIRDWTGLLPLAQEGADVLQLIVRQRGLNFAPGEEWSYSNSGYVLLKEIVARSSGMSFAEFSRRRLFEPLGMKASSYVPDIMHGGANIALGYQKEGAGWKQFMRLGNNRGGGAVISTAGDMLLWNEALTSGRLGRFVTAKLQEPATLNKGRKLTYARGLIVDNIPGGRIVSHSGGAAGYSTWLGRFTDHNLSVVVMCNFDPVSATQLATRVADLFLPPVDQTQRPGPVAVAGADVAGRAGVYFEERTGEPLRLIANNGRLAIGNGPPLVPVSANRFLPPRASLFFRSEDKWDLTFLSNDEIEIKSMEGPTTRYRRALPWKPVAADLQAVDGRYHSEEIGSTFEILPGTNGLVMRSERAPEKSVELEPVARDTYMRSLMIVRVRRDPSGKITGFDYSNPLVRNIRFTRVGARTAPASTTAAPP